MTQPELVIDLVKAEMRSINHFSLGGKSLKQERDYNTLAAWLSEAEAKAVYVIGIREDIGELVQRGE